MNAKQRNRLYTIVSIALGGSCAVGLVLYALSQNINLFLTPAEVAQGRAQVGDVIRLGGMVAPGTVKSEVSLDHTFEITDYAAQMQVVYHGILPDLFKEGQGVVVQGTLERPDCLRAKQVLAKHDEKYMPPQIEKKLAKSL